jgi:hypothetical protein
MTKSWRVHHAAYRKMIEDARPAIHIRDTHLIGSGVLDVYPRVFMTQLRSDCSPHPHFQLTPGQGTIGAVSKSYKDPMSGSYAVSHRVHLRGTAAYMQRLGADVDTSTESGEWV